MKETFDTEMEARQCFINHIKAIMYFRYGKWHVEWNDSILDRARQAEEEIVRYQKEIGGSHDK